MLAKRKYKVRVLAHPVPTTPTAPVNSTAPTPTVATTSTQMPVTRSAAKSILVMVYKLATGQFAEVPYLTARPQDEGHPSTQSSNPPPLEDIPNAPIRQGTPWLNPGSAPENLFQIRKDWPIPHTPAPTPIVKKETPPQIAAILWVMVTPKQVTEKCSWGPHCPISKTEEEQEEDWDGNRQREQPRMCTQNRQQPYSHKLLSNTSHRTISTPSHLMSLTDTLNRFYCGKNGKKELKG